MVKPPKSVSIDVQIPRGWQYIATKMEKDLNNEDVVLTPMGMTKGRLLPRCGDWPFVVVGPVCPQVGQYVQLKDNGQIFKVLEIVESDVAVLGVTQVLLRLDGVLELCHPENVTIMTEDIEPLDFEQACAKVGKFGASLIGDDGLMYSITQINSGGVVLNHVKFDGEKLYLFSEVAQWRVGRHDRSDVFGNKVYRVNFDE